jgi:hypothetical protein
MNAILIGAEKGGEEGGGLSTDISKFPPLCIFFEKNYKKRLRHVQNGEDLFSKRA